MTNKQNLTTKDINEFLTSYNPTSGLVADSLLELRKIKNFNDSFMLPRFYSFNFQAAERKTPYSSYGTILSFAKDASGMYAVINKKMRKNTNILLNILIDKIHLNLIGSITQILPAKTTDFYIAEIIFKDLSQNDKNNILNFLSSTVSADSDFSERRKYIRLAKSLPVTYQLYKQDKTLSHNTALVYTIDISQEGFKIASGEELSVDDMLYIQMQVKHSTVFCTGKVIWVKYSDAGKRYLAGIKFEDISEQTKEHLIDLVMN